MKRRANGEGSIRQRKNGRWEGRLVLPDGTRRSVYGATQREVLEKAKEVQRSSSLGISVASDRQTLREYLSGWLEAKRAKVRPTTWLRYEIHCRVDVAPRIGDVAVTKLGPQHLERLYGELLEGGKAPISVRRIHALLHHALGQAVRWGLLPRNVCELVDPPKAERREMVTLDEERYRTFLAAVAAADLEALYVLAVTTGMRQGELLGLRWRDVDLEKAALQVRQNVTWRSGKWSFGAPKTQKSRRQIELSDIAVAALRRHRPRQLEARLRSAGAWDDHDLVFANEVGRPIEPSNLTQRSFRPLLAGAGLPRMRFHDLRHTAATIALGRGSHPKKVSEMLGHSSVATTLDLYSHVTPTMQREVAAVFDAVAAGAR